MAENGPKENSNSGKTIQLEILELDDIALDAVTGGIAAEQGGDSNSNCVVSCTSNTNCPC